MNDKIKKVIVERNRALANTVISALEKRNFEAFYCATKKEAHDKALSLIPLGSTVAWGGSESVLEIGLIDSLYEKNKYTIIDRDKAANAQEKRKLDRQAFSSDYYLMSTNGISEDGQLVNIDGNGNRVAALSYGPDYIIMIVGLHKVTKTLDDAVARARGTAAPLNSLRCVPNNGMPCLKNGVCHNCKIEAGICNQFLITRMCKPAKRIKIILIGDILGF